MTLWNMVSTTLARGTTSWGRLYPPQEGSIPREGGRAVHCTFCQMHYKSTVKSLFRVIETPWVEKRKKKSLMRVVEPFIILRLTQLKQETRAAAYHCRTRGDCNVELWNHPSAIYVRSVWNKRRSTEAPSRGIFSSTQGVSTTLTRDFAVLL